jgi:hypothetical protein
MKQMKASHRKIAPKKETTKKRSLQISISLLEWTRSVTQALHGQRLEIGKTRIIVKVVGFFFFVISVAKGRLKPVILTPQRREDLSPA